MQFKRGFLSKLMLLASVLAIGSGLVSLGAKANSGPEEKESSNPPPAAKAEWVAIEAKIIELDGKIKTTQGNIDKLSRQKADLPAESSELKKVLDELVKEHRSLREFVEEWNAQTAVLRYRFPERGATKERKYEPKSVPPLEVIEDKNSVEYRIKKNLEQARKQFGRHVTQPKRNPAAESNPASNLQNEVKPRERVILEK